MRQESFEFRFPKESRGFEGMVISVVRRLSIERIGVAAMKRE